VTALAILLAAALVALLFILARSQPDDPVELSGRWTAEVPDAPGRSFPLVLELRTAGDQLLGSATFPTGEGSIQEGRVQGRQLSLHTQHLPQFADGPAITRFAGELQKDGLHLTMQSDTSVREFVARRQTVV